ncbi:MAG TPA: glutamine cyclotransferase [Chitinophagaceae bacterium]|nr:glutamine cyclotransferase [Chitinophagaceae bacterium]HRF26119.1 glutaminyl-peptide cyclotransferase [Ferruginibacter sp.]
MKKLLYLLCISLLACNGDKEQETDPELPAPAGIPAPLSLNVSIVGQYPHDTSAYTQGLVWHNGKLYEGTGDYESSSLRISDLKSGAVQQKHMMGSNKIFGEGITIFNDKIYQLTWQSNIVYVYALNDITKPIQTLQWPYEGWGITHNGKDLIISDGSSNLYFVDPGNLRVRNTLSVRDNRGPVILLNELEFINGMIFANVYESNAIIQIDPESGHVKGIVNLPGLLKPQDVIAGRTDVLNGIAYDSSTGHLMITGKRWPKMFEIKLQ